jgi:hypothetical protein
VVARERVTVVFVVVLVLALALALDGRAAAVRAFALREVRADDVLRFVRAGRLGVWRLADREGAGFRDEDFTDYSPGMTAMVR